MANQAALGVTAHGRLPLERRTVRVEFADERVLPVGEFVESAS